MPEAWKRITHLRVLLLCAAALLCACHRDAGSTAASTPAPAPKAPVVKKGPTAAEQTAGMVQAAAQGKSPLPVELKFEVTQRPKVGQALDINLALISQIDASPASVKVTGADGLSLAPEAAQFDIASIEAGEVNRQTLHVTPTAEGVLIIGVTASLKHEEVTDQKVFSFPIIVER
jgi:hypothetical protein